jgi:3-oxoacyl-[acyl-carrier-protein] synthase II
VRPLPRPAIEAVAAISAIGATWPETWAGLLSGRSGISRYVDIDSRFKVDCPVAAIPDLDRHADPYGTGPSMRLASRLFQQVYRSDRQTRIFGANNHGDIDLDAMMGQRLPVVSWDPARMLGAFSNRIQWNYAACSSGLVATILAMQGWTADEDTVLVSADTLNPVEIMGFLRLGAISLSGCRPFHRSRDGLLVGEGGVALRLGAGDGGRAFRLLGAGLACDAGHSTDPDPTGRWMDKAISDAMRRAELTAHDIGAIICHGTGTAKNDQVEAAVIAARWPGAGVPITSLKGALGHTMGPSGLFSLLAAVETLKSGLLPPTCSDGSAIIDDIDVVRGSPRVIAVEKAILILASGFGGVNAVVIVGAVP